MQNDKTSQTFHITAQDLNPGSVDWGSDTWATVPQHSTEANDHSPDLHRVTQQNLPLHPKMTPDLTSNQRANVTSRPQTVINALVFCTLELIAEHVETLDTRHVKSVVNQTACGNLAECFPLINKNFTRHASATQGHQFSKVICLWSGHICPMQFVSLGKWLDTMQVTVCLINWSKIIYEFIWNSILLCVCASLSHWFLTNHKLTPQCSYNPRWPHTSQTPACCTMPTSIFQTAKCKHDCLLVTEDDTRWQHIYPLTNH